MIRVVASGDRFVERNVLMAIARRAVRTGVSAGIAVVLAGGTLVAAGAGSAQAASFGMQARRICAVDTVSYSTPQKGHVVYIPTNLAAGTYQVGGTQSVSYADGDLKATTKGSSDTVGGGGGIDFKLFSASATYNHTWNRSTTVTTSHTRTYTTTSPQLPAHARTRWTLYHKGYQFPVKTIVTYTNDCPTQTFTRTVHVPTKSWAQTQWSWEVQYAAHPHQLH
jgi:hypothetical protein